MKGREEMRGVFLELDLRNVHWSLPTEHSLFILDWTVDVFCCIR